MDDSTLDSLYLALEADRDNAGLITVLFGAHMTREEPNRAIDLMRDHPAEVLPPATRVQWAELLLNEGQAEQASAAYESAVAENATVEDPQIAEAIAVANAASPAPVDEGRPTLRVLSTGQTEGVEDNDVTPLIGPPTDPVNFDDVGGLDDLKKRIRRKIILPLQKPSLFERFKKRTGGGVLLYGAPGCGKTLMARATAGECNATFINVQITDVLDMWLGESEGKLSALFQRAREEAPSVLFFDEVEALGGKRQHTRQQSTANLVSQFLSEMDGFNGKNSGVLILGATNVPWAVDPAFRRPGRFDRVLFVPPPDREARKAIIEIHLRDRPTSGTLDLAKLAKKTPGFSGADLENLVETAVDLAIEASLEEEREVPVDQKLLDEALGDVRPTTLEWLTTARNYARYANEGGQYDEVLKFIETHGK